MTTYAMGDRVLVRVKARAPESDAEMIEDRVGSVRVRTALGMVTVPKSRCRPVPEKVVPARVEPMLPSAPLVPVATPERIAQARAELRAVPKPPSPWRSSDYMAFVRAQRQCCCCGRRDRNDDPIVAHHHGPHAMSQKASDSMCVPLADSCHRYFHDHGVFRGTYGNPMTRERTDAHAKRWQADLLTAYVHSRFGDAHSIIVDALTAALRERS